MITQKQLKEHFLGLKNAIYVWGANCEAITEAMIEKLYNNYRTSTYNRAYYDGKFAEGKGKIGADCSGSLYPLSGYDTTAAGYYDRCTKKWAVGSIPKDKVCLVFKVNSKGSINHVGCYTGDGYVSEMASSKKNYQRKPLADNGWDLWGLPDFVDYEVEEKNLLEVDGEWGRDTTTKSQHVLGTKEDGIVSNQPVSCQKYLPNAQESSWEFERTNYKRGSNLIKAIQELVGMTGRDVDGHCGRDTVTAMQIFLQEFGFYTGKIDGKMGPKTVMAWQQYINSRL